MFKQSLLKTMEYFFLRSSNKDIQVFLLSFVHRDQDDRESVSFFITQTVSTTSLVVLRRIIACLFWCEFYSFGSLVFDIYSWSIQLKGLILGEVLRLVCQ